MEAVPVRDIVAERMLTPPPIDVSPYIDRILQTYGERVVGIFMYGSMLSDVTKSQTSFPDFFVITDGYRKVFRRFSHWLWAHFLPPHIYHLRLDERRNCKYNLVSLRRFERETSRRAKDIYILGRFCKRVSLVYARDEESRRRLLDCCANAVASCVPWALRGMSGPFDREQFVLATLNLSYAGETRVEAASKVPKLYAAEKAYYDAVIPRLLDGHAERQHWVRSLGNGGFEPTGGRLARFLRGLRLAWFLKKSRIRGILRWPKFLITVDEWVDIILAKIERTKGIKLEVTERQRRHPLIFGWPHLFRLIKAGAIGSTSRPPDKNAISKEKKDQ